MQCQEVKHLDGYNLHKSRWSQKRMDFFFLHVLAECNTDSPKFHNDMCSVHCAKSVCDLFDNYEGTGLHNHPTSIL